jgi:hypothetical protein
MKIEDIMKLLGSRTVSEMKEKLQRNAGIKTRK